MKKETNFRQQDINSSLKCIYDNLDLATALVDHLLEKNKEDKKSKKQSKVYTFFDEKTSVDAVKSEIM